MECAEFNYLCTIHPLEIIFTYLYGKVGYCNLDSVPEEFAVLGFKEHTGLTYLPPLSSILMAEYYVE